MRCPNCQTLNPEGAKFCLECGNKLLVCPNCHTVNLPQAKFCIECGTALATQSTPQPAPPSPVPASRQTQPLPDILTNPEERRVVTIMFADIIGSTPLADHLDPEDMRAILTGYFNLMTAQIRKHGGTVEKYIGDAVMAVFGTPVAHEDDPDRAIRAALDMQKALKHFNQSRQAQDKDAIALQMRIGINTGEVAAPNNREHKRRDFLITGDAVNVAARLQQVASADTILVGERTYRTTRNVFDFQALAPLHIKGKPEPIPAWVVRGSKRQTTAISQHPRGIEGLQANFVGRSLELALMHATYARVQAEKRPHLITLLGVPGIGKSRLVREFIEREQKSAQCASCDNAALLPRVLQGRCPPYGEGITYWPLVEILRALLQAEDEENSEVLQRRLLDFVRDTLTQTRSIEDPGAIATALIRSIGRTPGSKTSELTAVDGRERQRSTNTRGKTNEQSGPQVELMRAWRVLLESLAQQQPLIIIIDDLQWADEALLDLLEYLTDRINEVPVLFLCPARPDFFERRRDWGGGRRNFTTIELEALSKEESSTLVNELLNTDELPGVIRHTILTRAEGNPFFVEEIVRMLIDQDILIYRDGCWHVQTKHEPLLGELVSPATPPEDTLIDQHYVFPLPHVPDTIQGVLAARVDLLSLAEKRVLQHASIIGRTFWLQGLLELAADIPEPTVLNLLERLIERGFITETEKQGRSPVEHDRIFSFKHVLIRDVVYNNIPRVRRSYEHAQIAQWIEAQTTDRLEQFVELLAYHYQQALALWSATLLPALPGANTERGTQPPVRLTRSELRQRAIKYLTLAGNQALESYFTIRAIQAYSEALELLADSDAEALALAYMHQKLGDAYMQRASGDEAWHEYRQALQSILKVADVEQSQLLYLYIRLSELGTRWLGLFNTNPDMQEVRSYIDAGIRLLEGEAESGKYAEFLTFQAFWYVINQFYATDTQERNRLAELALQSGKEALRIAEKLQDTDSLWVTLDALGYIYRKHHRYREAHEMQHYRLRLVDQIKSREEIFDLYYTLGWVHQGISDYNTAAKWFGRATRIAQTMESPSMLLNSMSGRMYLWIRWNRWQDARDVAENIMQLIEQYQLHEQWQLEPLEALIIVAYRTGNTEQGDRYTRQYKRILDQYGTPTWCQPTQAFIYRAREDWTRALAAYREEIQRSEPFPSPRILAILAELSVITGESAEEQKAISERAVTLAQESGDRKSIAVALRARGRMHLEQQHWSEAHDDLQAALQLCKELDISWERGQTFYCLGLFYRRRADILYKEDQPRRADDRGRARYHFEKALGFFESLQAVRDVERVRLALKQDNRALV